MKSILQVLGWEGTNGEAYSVEEREEVGIEITLSSKLIGKLGNLQVKILRILTSHLMYVKYNY